MVAPTKTVQCYFNNNPWVPQRVKAFLNKKKRAFRNKDKEEMKAAQWEVKRCLKEAKDSYREKVEQKLRENNMREVWEGVRTFTGHKAKTSTEGEGVERVNDLNNFFNRFSHSTPPPSLTAASSPPPPSASPPRQHSRTLLPSSLLMATATPTLFSPPHLSLTPAFQLPHRQITICQADGDHV